MFCSLSWDLDALDEIEICGEIISSIRLWLIYAKCGILY